MNAWKINQLIYTRYWGGKRDFKINKPQFLLSLLIRKKPRQIIKSIMQCDKYYNKEMYHTSLWGRRSNNSVWKGQARQASKKSWHLCWTVKDGLEFVRWRHWDKDILGIKNIMSKVKRYWHACQVQATWHEWFIVSRIYGAASGVKQDETKRETGIKLPRS